MVRLVRLALRAKLGILARLDPKAKSAPPDSRAIQEKPVLQDQQEPLGTLALKAILDLPGLRVTPGR